MREATNDLEITCDEAVVKNCSNDERADYCETILRTLSRGRNSFTPLSTGFNSGKKGSTAPL
jgi:beta-lactamase regulating signal transducer with metallopeptidase domain